MVWKNFRQKKEEGQALIEFLLGLMVVISFFFFYIRMCAVFAIGNYIHYATFMAARTLSASTVSADQQESNAQAIVDAMITGHFKSFISPSGSPVIGPGDFYNNDSLQDSWNQGVSYSFKTKLSLYPWNKTGQSIDLDLTSNSWMPREEDAQGCKAKKARIIGVLVQNGIKNLTDIEWDNGDANGC